MSIEATAEKPTTLEGVFALFEESIQSLSTLAQLRSPDTAAALSTDPLALKLFAALDQLEARLEHAKTIVTEAKDIFELGAAAPCLADGAEEPEDIMPGAQLIQHVATSNAMLQHMLANIPRHLPTATSKAQPPSRAQATAPQPAKGQAVPQTSGASLSNELGGLVTPSISADNLNELAESGGPIQEDSKPPSVIEEPAGTKVGKKMTMAVDPLTVQEYESLPKYLVNRLTRDKLNDCIAEFNKVIAEKYAMLRIPQAKMNKIQRDRFWEHKRVANESTKGHAFVTEKEIKENYAKTLFRLDPVGRSFIAIARHLGRVREVRGGNCTRIVVM
ncbi:hypothetical protein DFJ73DRAFT_867782 [Zopfochytrium polystomum]|nr:hypothetical protein DFJ73DRAFT_867782 [Zopfochytrium polystomum]